MAAKKGQGYEERMARGKKCLNVWISDDAMAALDALRKGRSRAAVVEELARRALARPVTVSQPRPPTPAPPAQNDRQAAEREVQRSRQELSMPRPAPTPPQAPARQPLQASQLDPHRRRPQARPVALTEQELSPGARIGRRNAALLHGGSVVGDGGDED